MLRLTMPMGRKWNTTICTGFLKSTEILGTYLLRHYRTGKVANLTSLEMFATTLRTPTHTYVPVQEQAQLLRQATLFTGRFFNWVIMARTFGFLLLHQ